jgi:hypothetical protein
MAYTGSVGNLYFTNRYSTTGFTCISDITPTIITVSTPVTFTWTSYSKDGIIFSPSFMSFGSTVFYFGCTVLETLTTGFAGLTTSANGFNERQNSIPCARFTTSTISCTYHIFNNINPQNLTFMFTYGVNETQWVVIGNLTKINDVAYTGGTYFSASAAIIDTPVRYLNTFTETEYKCTGGSGQINGLFFSKVTNDTPSAGYISHNVDGGLRLSRSVVDGSFNAINTSILTGQNTTRKLFRGLNVWNAQVVLVPCELYYVNTANHLKYLGHTEHVRLMRVDNYNAGDIITIGSDTWKSFPMIKKDLLNRNNNTGGATSGTLGLAIRYTP